MDGIIIIVICINKHNITIYFLNFKIIHIHISIIYKLCHLYFEHYKYGHYLKVACYPSIIHHYIIFEHSGIYRFFSFQKVMMTENCVRL